MASISQTKARLAACWKSDIDWTLYPQKLREVMMYYLTVLSQLYCCILTQGCSAIGQTLGVPATAVLVGLISLASFVLAHSDVRCTGTRWTEPIIVWLAVATPTGSGKSTLYKFLFNLLQNLRKKCGRKESHPTWNLEEATFEKNGCTYGRK